MSALPKKDWSHIVIAEGYLSKKKQTIETKVHLGESVPATVFEDIQQNKKSTVCNIRPVSVAIKQQIDWNKTTTDHCEWFVLPKYGPKHFGPQLIEFPESVQWENITPIQAINDIITPKIHSTFPILNHLGIKNIFGYTRVGNIVKPYINLPSGCGLFIYPKPFFDLLGLAKYVSELFDMTGEHPQIRNDESYWGLFNSHGEAVRCESDIDNLIERTTFKQLYYVDQDQMTKPEESQDESEDEIMDTESSAQEGRGRKRISSDGQLHRTTSAKRVPFSGFHTSIKMYIYFDNSTTSMVDGLLTGRRVPLTIARIPLYTHLKTDELMFQYNQAFNLFNPSKKIFDRSLTTDLNESAIFKAKTNMKSNEPWSLSLTAEKLNPDQIVTYEKSLYFEVFLNRTMCRLMGYEEPLIEHQLQQSPFYFRYRPLSFAMNLTFVTNNKIMPLLRDPFPLFLCINTPNNNITWPQKEGAIVATRYSVAAIVNKDNNIFIIKDGHTINIQLDHPSTINIQVVSKEGVPVSNPVHVFATFVINK